MLSQCLLYVVNWLVLNITVSHFNLLFVALPCRTLSSSDDVQDRETEKSRLEDAYEKCDRELDEKIVRHYTELTTAIRTYQSITERITSSRNKIKQVSAEHTDGLVHMRGSSFSFR